MPNRITRRNPPEIRNHWYSASLRIARRIVTNALWTLDDELFMMFSIMPFIDEFI
jgi:hypothetical protein